MKITNEIDDEIRSLRETFLTRSVSHLDEVDEMLGEKISRPEELDLEFIRRRVHDFKGRGAIFGVVLVSEIARHAEDYLRTVDQLDKEGLLGLRAYFQAIRGAVERHEDMDEAAFAAILSELPKAASHSDRRAIGIL